MSTERNTHFQGFAKLLYDDFLQLREADKSSINEILTDDYIDKWRSKVETLIAQRAYDLVEHCIEFFRYSPNIRPMQLSSTETWIHFLPDLTEWPTPPTSAPASPAPD